MLSGSRSRFSKYANAVLTLQIPTEGLQRDEDGNYQPIYEPMEIKAILSESKSSQERSLPAVDVSQLYVEGVLVDPMQFPPGVQPPLECDAVIDERRGRLSLAIGIGTGIDKKAERKTGQVIQGYFSVIA